MLPNANLAARAKLIEAANKPSALFQWMRWQGDVEIYLISHYGYNPHRCANLMTAFHQRCPLDAYDWEGFKRWELEAVRQLSLGRLPHLPLDDAIEATMECY